MRSGDAQYNTEESPKDNCEKLAIKGRFTRYDFVAYDKLTTGLRHELFRVNQTYNSLNGPKSCRRPVVSLSYATKSYRINRP